MATTPKGIYYPNDYNEIADIPEDMKKMAESIDEVFEDTDSDLSDIKEEQTTQNNRLNSLEVDNTTNKSDILTNKQEINNIKTEQTTQNNRLNNLETDNTTNKDNISANTQEINNIKQEQTEQNTNITTNATNIESLQEENENLKKIVAQMPQVTGQGTEVTLENTIEAQFTKFDVEGNSTQETTEGYNMLDLDKYSYSESSSALNGGTVTIKDGVITLNATNATGNMTALSVTKLANADSIEAGTYYFGVDVYGAYESTPSTNIWEYRGNRTLTEKFIMKQWKFAVTQGNIASTPILVSNDTSKTNYEPYTNGASPNPNYEQPIYSAGDNGTINEKIQNKNWFNKNSNFKTYNASVTPIDTGIKVENNDGGTYRSVWCEIGKDELLGKTLTIQTSISTYNDAIPRIIVVFNNETDQYIEQIKTITDTTDGTIVNIPNSFPENADRVSLIFYCSFGSATPTGSYVEYKNLQVELGSTATPYVPHEEQDYSIPVQAPFRSNKDKTIRDCFVKKSDNKKYERHYIGEVVLNGSEEIYLYNDNGNRAVFYINVSDLYDYTNSAETPELLSNRFRPTSQQATWVPGEISCRIGERAIFFIFETGTTINDFKNWLSTHNVVVQYLLAEPLDLPCTPEQVEQLENKPSTYKDFTIINSENETKAYLEVSGIRDINTMFDKVTNAIISLGGNV